MNPFINAKGLLFAIVTSVWYLGAQALEPLLGDNVESLLAFAWEKNPEYTSMRYEAEAAAERIMPAGALPDPKFRLELRDITRMSEKNPTLAPNQVGSTRYLFMQDVPWFGKRNLKRSVAGFEAESAKKRVLNVWTEIAAKIKTTYAQLYYLYRNERLTRENFELMAWLEKISQVRYANGLSSQQDIIQAQIEQTNIRNELLELEAERRQAQARLNALLARPATAPLAEPKKLRILPLPAKLDYAELEERVRSHNPLLSSEDARIKASEKDRELTYKNRYPDFTFSVSPIQYQNSIKEWELMIEVNIPLQQSSRRAQERAAEAMLSAARSRRESTMNQILADLSDNLAGIDAARQTEVLITSHLLPQAELTFRTAIASYETGRVDFSTLIEAQRRIRQVKQRQIKVQKEGQTRLAEIERILGEDL